MLRAYEIASERGLEVDHRVGLSTPGSPGHRYSNLFVIQREDHLRKTSAERRAKKVVAQLLRDGVAEAAINDTNWTTIEPGEELADLPSPE